MNLDIVFFEPLLVERLWGGDYLKVLYSKPEIKEPIGEAWLVSGLGGKSSDVSDMFARLGTLDVFYEDHRHDLFGDLDAKELPILIKMIDAKTKLSVQVHPADDYASKHENASGKTECWYVLDAADDSFLIVGHTAKTKAELEKKIRAGQYDDLLKKVKIKADDFIYIPSGMLHAIGDGVRLVEVQQPSDITYRVYDYDRKDTKGNLRELHLEKALEVIETPAPEVKITNYSDSQGKVNLVDSEYFIVDKVTISSKMSIEKPKAAPIFFVVLKGEGSVKSTPIKTGSAFMVSKDAENVMVEGNIELLEITLPMKRGKK
ncbi:MAG: class I mannose-6-phosphate isomerase [Bacilli bacterium]|nr:class I mannose-6-phosphate isomerase [Bacilli bacterium]MBN2696575.1 class I mannose-6-phosphate isomerase [Bacilli bacterium]